MEEPKVRTFYKALTMAYSGEGRIDEAERVLRPVLDVERSISGANDVSTAHCEFLLAIILNKKGEYEEAAQLFRHARGIHQTEYRLDTLRIIHKVSSAFFSLKLWHEAEDLLEHQLKPCKGLTSGKRNRFSWLWIVQDLAHCYNQQGKFREAEDLLRDTLGQEEKSVAEKSAT
jgi:tetratricopeptide (TPR) repeat protein